MAARLADADSMPQTRPAPEPAPTRKRRRCASSIFPPGPAGTRSGSREPSASSASTARSSTSRPPTCTIRPTACSTSSDRSAAGASRDPASLHRRRRPPLRRLPLQRRGPGDRAADAARGLHRAGRCSSGSARRSSSPGRAATYARGRRARGAERPVLRPSTDRWRAARRSKRCSSTPIVRCISTPTCGDTCRGRHSSRMPASMSPRSSRAPAGRESGRDRARAHQPAP